MIAFFDNINGICSIEGNIPRRIVCDYDAKSKTLVAARDKIGEQTLYYAQLPTSVVVATDLKDILPHIAYPKINMLNLAQPIRYNFPIDLQQTWIEQIKRVRAGEELTIDQKGIHSRIYWKRDHTPTFKGSKEEAHAEALRLLRKSLKECIETSEGPVAVLLSGGIDSTSLAALTKEIQQEVHVISAGYKGNNYTACDERPEALDKGCFVIAGISEQSLLQAVDTAVFMQQNADFGIPVSDYVDENVSTKVVKIIQSYTNIVNKMVWRK